MSRTQQIDGVTYEAVPLDLNKYRANVGKYEYPACVGCAGFDDLKLCNRLGNCTEIIWVEKKEVPGLEDLQPQTVDVTVTFRYPQGSDPARARRITQSVLDMLLGDPVLGHIDARIEK